MTYFGYICVNFAARGTEQKELSHRCWMLCAHSLGSSVTAATVIGIIMIITIIWTCS